MTRAILCLSGLALTTAALLAGSNVARPSSTGIQGVWESHVQFKDGAFASVKDLQLLYSFNEGGTMTESSNYDESQPVPPAYGIWRSLGRNRFEAKSVYYNTKPPTQFEEISKGGGWAPFGKGVLVERITIAKGGNSYDSTLTLDLYDASGKHVDGGGHAVGHGTRLRF